MDVAERELNGGELIERGTFGQRVADLTGKRDRASGERGGGRIGRVAAECLGGQRPRLRGRVTCRQRLSFGQQRGLLLGGGHAGHQSWTPNDQLRRPGQVDGGGGPVTGAQRGIGGRAVQSERLVTVLPGLRRPCRVVQRGGGGAVIGGEVGRLLVSPLRLAGQAAGEAQLGEPDRQAVRLRAVCSVADRP